MRWSWVGSVLLLALLLAGCAGSQGQQRPLRLATTTSTEDSGLLDLLLPDFEQRYRIQVDVIAVGTGQALAMAARGDADVVLVHAPEQEQAFVTAGDGIGRRSVMYNDFVLVGPPDDPAGVSGQPGAPQALAAIARQHAPFASRGDGSGTHARELALWAAAGSVPEGQSWYQALGQGMGETLIFAHEQGAYCLTDRATYLAMRERLSGLSILLGGASLAESSDPALRNSYSVILVNPARHPGVQAERAEQFAHWLTSPPTQQQIAHYGLERFGQPLFYPAAASTGNRP